MPTISLRLKDDIHQELTEWIQDIDETKTGFIKRAISNQLKADKKKNPDEIYTADFLKKIKNYEDQKANGSLETLSSDDFWKGLIS